MLQSVHCDPPVAGYVEPEPDYDMNIYSNPDAAAWTDFYCEKNPDADWGTMMGWFSNAMMAMHDHVERKHEQAGAGGKLKMPILMDDTVVEVTIGRE